MVEVLLAPVAFAGLDVVENDTVTVLVEDNKELVECSITFVFVVVVPLFAVVVFVLVTEVIVVELSDGVDILFECVTVTCLLEVEFVVPAVDDDTPSDVV